MSIPYRLIRSDRRTLSLAIDGEGALVVRAPRFMPEAEIGAFLQKKRRWIAQKQEQARASRVEPLTPVDGARLPWLGGTLRLKLCRVPMCIDFDGRLLTPLTGDALAHIRAWRKRRAYEELAPRVRLWESRMGLQVQSIGFTEARKRWGSMNSARRLRLNAALAHCPKELCDYVIVHELAHIVHPDHSPAFHALVRACLPAADALRARLRGFGGVTALLVQPKEAS